MTPSEIDAVRAENIALKAENDRLRAAVRECDVIAKVAEWMIGRKEGVDPGKMAHQIQDAIAASKEAT